MRHPMAEPSQPWRVPKLLVQSSPAPAAAAGPVAVPCPLLIITNTHEASQNSNIFVQIQCVKVPAHTTNLTVTVCFFSLKHISKIHLLHFKPSTIDNCKYSVGLHLLFILSLRCDFQIIKLK